MKTNPIFNGNLRFSYLSNPRLLSLALRLRADPKVQGELHRSNLITNDNNKGNNNNSKRTAIKLNYNNHQRSCEENVIVKHVLDDQTHTL